MSIHAAIVAALSELTGVPKTRTAKIPTKNGGEYKYEYANIEDVVEHTRPVLAKHGLVVLQPTCETTQGMGVRTVLVHESGETFDAGTLPFRSAGDPQRDGMAITYYRRYALLSALGMAAEDDDGTVTRPDHAAPEPEPVVGVTSKDLGARIRHSLEVVSLDDPEGGHAKAIWTKAAPKAADDGLIYATEAKRVMAVAAQYVAEQSDEAGSEPF